ncbi:MAG TPA: cupin domain-containing protein [Opitutaceae bacterium]|nr:cupin domain-containing protein [Opitutaceae bacterium]
MKPLLAIAFLFLGLISRAADAPAAPAAMPPPPTEVMVFNHVQVDDAFAKGLPLQGNSSFKISAGRRVMPGTVELHTRDTDILYVTDGTATFITGGKMVDAKPSGPDEVRGTSITGGVAHQLNKGDLIIVPAGIPHWFSDVKGTFLYLVIKVTR